MRIKHMILGSVIAVTGLGFTACRDAGYADRDTAAVVTDTMAVGGSVEAYSDANGNYFKPADFEVHQGDTIRFTLKSGVHNVHFLPDSNPGRTGLPAASDLLQIPGQTYDLPVTFAEGRYYYQCDPHAALGMKGHIKVED